MKAGKSTDTLDHRLDALAPGPAFDKAAAWSKLQQRLEKKKKQAFIPWTWAAAAAILIFIAYLVIPAAKKETGIAVKPGPAAQPAVTGQQIKPILQEQPVVIPIAEKSTVLNNIQQAYVKKKGIVPDSLLFVNEKQNPEPAPVETAVAVLPDPPLQPLLAPVQQKKLRVVFNNELVNATTEESLPAAAEPIAEKSFFKRTRFNNPVKAESPFAEEPQPRSRKGILPFGISFKPKD